MCITNRRPSFVSLGDLNFPTSSGTTGSLGLLRSDLSDVATLLEQHQQAQQRQLQQQEQGLIQSLPQKMALPRIGSSGSFIYMTHHNFAPKTADAVVELPSPQPQPRPLPQPTLSQIGLPEPVPSNIDAVRLETKKKKQHKQQPTNPPPPEKKLQQRKPQQQQRPTEPNKTPPSYPVNKKLLPGFTAKHHTRHYVKHNYHDHAYDAPEGWEEKELQLASERQELARAGGGGVVSSSATKNDDALGVSGLPSKGGVPVPFPLRLHEMLDRIEDDGHADVISWQPHGRAFVVHNVKTFVSTIMPKYFRQTKITSFQRQLNLYGFSRITRGRDRGGYYHELFLRGRRFLCNRMVRTKVKGTKIKAVSSPESEPNFYAFPPLGDCSAPAGVAPSAAVVASVGRQMLPSAPVKIASSATPPSNPQPEPVVSSDPTLHRQQEPPKSSKVCGGIGDQSDLLLDFEGMTFHYLNENPATRKCIADNNGNDNRGFPQLPQNHSFGEEAPDLPPELGVASDADNSSLTTAPSSSSLTSSSSSTRSSFSCGHHRGGPRDDGDGDAVEPVISAASASSAAVAASSERHLDDVAMDDFFSSFDVPLDDEGMMNHGVLDNDVDLGFLLERIVE